MDNAIKAAILKKREKVGMDPAFNSSSTGQMTDEEDHKDLAPDSDSSGDRMDGHQQNVNPNRPDNEFLGFKTGEEGEELARAGQNEHIYPQEMFTDVTKQPRKFNDKNVGRMMAGDGTDPQHDKMGVDEHMQLLEQDSPANMPNHSKSDAMTKAVQAKLGKYQGVDLSDPGSGSSETMRTAKLQANNASAQSPSLRGGLEMGKNDNQRFTHKPMAAAKDRMNKNNYK